jgi:hypothetical protein
MEYSDNTPTPAQAPQFTLSEFQRLADIFLEFYQEGKYSLESIEDGEATHNQRKSIKNDFKDHLFGDSKFRKAYGTDARKKWSRYTVAMFKALLQSDIHKYLDMRKRYRSVKKELDELKNISPEVRQNEIDAEVRRLLPIKVTERIEGKIALADRMNSRIPQYQAIIDRQNKEIESLKETLENCVDRNELLDAHAQTLQYKDLYFKAKAKADKVDIKSEAKAEAERRRKLEQIAKLQQELDATS